MDEQSFPMVMNLNCMEGEKEDIIVMQQKVCLKMLSAIPTAMKNITAIINATSWMAVDKTQGYFGLPHHHQ